MASNSGLVLFLDVETSGYDKTNLMDRSGGYKFQIVSIGMIVVSSSNWKTRSKTYLEIQWNGTSKWDPDAERIHKLSKEHLAKNGLTEEEAFCAICEFIATHFDTGSSIIIGGHNTATFDRHFLLQLFSKYECTIQLSGRSIDTYTLGKVGFECNNSTEVFELVGATRAAHNALEDAQLALNVVKLFHSVVGEAVK